MAGFLDTLFGGGEMAKGFGPEKQAVPDPSGTGGSFMSNLFGSGSRIGNRIADYAGGKGDLSSSRVDPVSGFRVDTQEGEGGTGFTQGDLITLEEDAPDVRLDHEAGHAIANDRNFLGNFAGQFIPSINEGQELEAPANAFTMLEKAAAGGDPEATARLEAFRDSGEMDKAIQFMQRDPGLMERMLLGDSRGQQSDTLRSQASDRVGNEPQSALDVFMKGGLPQMFGGR